MIVVPILFIAGAGGVGLWVRARAKKQKMLSKVPPEPKLPGGYVTFRRGAYLIFIEKADSPIEIEPPFSWGVVPGEAVDAAPGANDAQKAIAAAKAGALLIAAGALTYAEAVERSQRWLQGLIGNAPAAPKPAEFVAYGRAKGLLTVVIGQVPKPPPKDATPATVKWEPTVPPTFAWALLPSSFIRDALMSGAHSINDVMNAGPEPFLGNGMTNAYADAVKAADEKAAGITFSLWAHRPPYGTAEMLLADAALRRRKKAA